MTDKPINPTLLALCQSFHARAEALGMKGKRRDDATMEFFVGASQALAIAEHEHAPVVLRVTALLIAMRGYRYIAETVKIHGAE
jgi:hypothetical protein